MKARKTKLEGTIQAEIEAALGAEPDLLLLRNSVGEARFSNMQTGQMYVVPYGLGVGSPDLVGILRAPSGVGTLFCLEVKSLDGRIEPEQARCHMVWKSFGAFVEVVRSADEARDALARARRQIGGAP